MGEESTVPVLCSFGGEIVPKYGKFVYEGGTTRLMRVHLSINFLNLLCRVNEIYRPTVISTVKYRYPGLELDCPLVSVTTDEDVSGMMQEFSSPTATPIQLFAFAPPSSLGYGTFSFCSWFAFVCQWIMKNGLNFIGPRVPFWGCKLYWIWGFSDQWGAYGGELKITMMMGVDRSHGSDLLGEKLQIQEMGSG